MRSFNLLWNLYQLKRNEHKTKEQVKAIQEKKLHRLLKIAYQHSPYYHRAFKEAGITEENLLNLPLSAFPTMDKDILMEHFEEIITKPELTQERLRRFDEEKGKGEKFLEKYHIVHSSGSTGLPKYFVYDDRAWEQMLLGIIRGALWDMSIPQILRLLSGGLRILYIAATDGRYGGAMAVGDGIKGVGAKQLFLDIKTPLSQWITSIQEFQPNLIIGYPSAIKILGELMEHTKVKVEVCRVISCGEPLSPGLRAYLEKVFRAVVVNFYGASESLALGVETNGTEGIYLFTRTEILLGRSEDILWFEDEEGKQEFLHPLSIEGF